MKISVKKELGTLGCIEHIHFFLSHKTPLERSKEKWKRHGLTRWKRKGEEKTPGMQCQPDDKKHMGELAELLKLNSKQQQQGVPPETS